MGKLQVIGSVAMKGQAGGEVPLLSCLVIPIKHVIGSCKTSSCRNI